MLYQLSYGTLLQEGVPLFALQTQKDIFNCANYFAFFSIFRDQ